MTPCLIGCLRGATDIVKYRQCRLVRQDGTSRVEHVSWLPEQYAIKGLLLSLRDKAGNWSREWKVISVSELLLDEKYVSKLNRAYLKQRKASDI